MILLKSEKFCYYRMVYVQIKLGLNMGLYIIIGILICCVIIVAIDSNRFHTVRYDIPTTKLEKEVHFVFVSDLHGKSYGKQNMKLIKAIDLLEPMAVFIGGDLLTARPKEPYDVALSFLNQIQKKYPVYYANGNHEHRLNLYPEKYGEMGASYEAELNKRKLKRILNDKIEDVFEQVDLFGLEMDKIYYKRFHAPSMPGDYLKKTLPSIDMEKYTVLMAHNPAYFSQYASWGADLVLSGHVHGGVGRLPFLGGVISPDLTLFPKYDGGLFTLNHSKMIVSRGLGAHTIPFRFLNPGELVSIHLIPVRDEEKNAR